MDLKNLIMSKREKKGLDEFFSKGIPMVEKTDIPYSSPMIPFSAFKGTLIKCLGTGKKFKTVVAFNQGSGSIVGVDINYDDIVTILLPSDYELKMINYETTTETEEGEVVVNTFSKYSPVDEESTDGDGKPYKAYRVMMGDFIRTIINGIFEEIPATDPKTMVKLGQAIIGGDGDTHWYTKQYGVVLPDPRIFMVTDVDGDEYHINMDI